MERPEFIVIGGPNGAGKTTLIERYIRENGLEYVGADAIAAQMTHLNLSALQIAAGKEFLRRIHECINQRRSCIVETTLSGHTFRHFMRSAHKAGFVITITFVYVDSADFCVERVRERVRKGGHHVPENDVRRRFRRAAVNFWNLYRELADHWLLVYNTGGGPHDIAAGSPKEFFVRDVTRFKQFERLIDDG